MPLQASVVEVGPGLRLSYEERGSSSGPAVVFLHGPTDSWRSYEQVLERIPGSVRAVAVSQRGHGDSDKPESGYRIEDFAGDVTRLLDVLGIERAVLVAHSASCLVARRVAIDHPDRVAGLVLEASPSTLAGHPGLSEFVDEVVSGLEDPIDPELVRSFVVDTSSELVAPAFLDVLVAEALKVPARVWRETFAGLLGYDDLADLDRITAPTLLIWGDTDSLVDRQMQDDLLRRIPDTTQVVYPGIGHTPRWEDPRRFTDDVASFATGVR